jgi:hypothetical protein
LLDGIDNNQVSDNLAGYTPSMDAIQEFNMITSNAPAEFGNFQGGIISATIKSGTNQLRGGLFEFRNDVLNANHWEANWACRQAAALRTGCVGTCLAGRLASQSRKTSCSSLATTRGSVLPTRPPPAQLLFLQKQSDEGTSHNCSKRTASSFTTLTLITTFRIPPNRHK